MRNVKALPLALLVMACEWPFNTTPTDPENLMGLTITHDIDRLLDPAPVRLSWDEVTVAEFSRYEIERKQFQDTSWTPVAILRDPLQAQYVDTIRDDEDLTYRVGIFNRDNAVRWSFNDVSIPRTTALYVPLEFDTIQYAFNSPLMDDGDSIIVEPGWYRGSLSLLGKAVHLLSTEGYNSTIIIADSARRGITINSGIVEGFRIEPFLEAGGGITLKGSAAVRKCLIIGARFRGLGGGVYLSEGGSLYNNVIYNNSSRFGAGGIHLRNAHGRVINNSIVNNGIIFEYDCDSLQFYNNIVHWSGLSFKPDSIRWGVKLDYSLLPRLIDQGDNNITGDPRFVSLSLWDFHLEPDSPCINAGHPGDQYRNRDGTRNTMGAFGGPYGE